MKLEWVIFEGRRMLWLHVSVIVGFAGANLKDDVLLIQGFFNYIANGLGGDSVGLSGAYKVPEITGVMDAETYSAIGEFQIYNARILLNGAHFDGRIHPGNFNNRYITTQKRTRNMCISLLNILAMDAKLVSGGYDHVQNMASLNSQLANAIDRTLLSP